MIGNVDSNKTDPLGCRSQYEHPMGCMSRKEHSMSDADLEKKKAFFMMRTLQRLIFLEADPY